VVPREVPELALKAQVMAVNRDNDEAAAKGMRALEAKWDTS